MMGSGRLLKTVIVVAFFLLGVLLLRMIEKGGGALSLLITESIVALIFLSLKPVVGVYLLLLTVFLSGFVTLFKILPRFFYWLPEILILFLFIIVFFPKLMRRERIYLDRLGKIIIVFLGWLVLSALINNYSISELFFGLRFCIRFYLFFFAITNLRLTESERRGAIWLMLALMLIQIPVAAVEYNIWGSVDFTAGTLGHKANHQLSFVMIALASLMLGFAFNYKRRFLPASFAGLSFIPPLFGTARIHWITFPLTILFVLRGYIRRHMKEVFLSIIFLCFGVALLLMVYPKSRKVLLKTLPTKERFKTALSVETYLGPSGEFVRYVPGRFFVLKEALRYSTMSLKSSLVGYGPGSTAYSLFGGFRGRLYSDTFTWKNQIATALLEWGMIGLLLYILIIAEVYRKVRSISHRFKERFWESVLFGFSGVWIAYVFSHIIYVAAFDRVSSLTFWLILGLILNKEREVK